MAKKRVKQMVYHAAAIALVIIATGFLKIPIPTGYIHLGDGVIFVAGALLGPLAAIPAAIGSSIADLIASFAIYAPVTFVIKGLMGLLAGLVWKSRDKFFRNLLIFLLAEIIMILGYFLFESFFYNLGAAIGALPFNLIQAGAGIVMGAVFVPATKNIRL